MGKLSKVKGAVLFDLDGVIYRGEALLPGAVEAVLYCRSKGYATFFLTNNSTRSRRQYVEKLGTLGIECSEEEIITSGYATAQYLRSRSQGAKVFVIGEEGLREELRLAGLRLVYDGHVDFVVVGMDRNFTYKKLMKAQRSILSGAKLIATNPDATFPTEDGLLPGAGSIVAAVERATGRRALVIGKPKTFMLELALRRCGARAEDSVVVGDRLDTDIKAGRRAGMKTVLVLTGVTSEEEARRARGELRPLYIIPDLRHLKRVVK